MSKVEIYIDNLNEEQDKACYNCSVRGNTYRAMIPFPVCKLAQLEENLEKIPTHEEAVEHKIDTSEIPQGCH
ncbi:hypothetical protein KKC36_00460, partial [Patescibacteria group bacterium]|nr:hypothetical protein [Patescibacteria group bacterium]